VEEGLSCSLDVRNCRENILTIFVQTSEVTILIRNCSYLVRDPTHIERDRDVLLEGNRIRTIGNNLPIPADAEVLDARDCVVLPGLINAHTHLYQNFIKGISSAVPLVPWCNQVLFPTLGAIRAVMEAGNRRAPFLWSVLAALEMIRGGVTSCVDMDATAPEILRAWEAIGFRGVLAYTLSNKWVPAELRAGEESMKQQMLEFVDQFHHPDGLTTVMVAPSTLFLCSADFLQWAGEQARRLDLGMQTHIAETRGEVDDIVKETGRTPVEHLQYLGLLESRLSAVHCANVSAEDVNLLAKAGALVVHCPKSNMKLADGIAPIAAMRKSGIPVGLGTDGCASNDLLDMWEEMRAAVMLARVSEGNAAAMSPQDAFSMATTEAARVARLDAGEIQPGKLADIIVIEPGGIHLRPFHDEDLINMLVFCGKSSDVRDTVIHGKIIMRGRRILSLDEAAIIQEAEALDTELLERRAEFQFSP
jgi:5-methylthioadenosine/S-adenosylhomocysteine deaminase